MNQEDIRLRTQPVYFHPFKHASIHFVQKGFCILSCVLYKLLFTFHLPSIPSSIYLLSKIIYSISPFYSFIHRIFPPHDLRWYVSQPASVRGIETIDENRLFADHDEKVRAVGMSIFNNVADLEGLCSGFPRPHGSRLPSGEYVDWLWLYGSEKVWKQ